MLFLCAALLGSHHDVSCVHVQMALLWPCYGLSPKNWEVWPSYFQVALWASSSHGSVFTSAYCHRRIGQVDFDEFFVVLRVVLLGFLVNPATARARSQTTGASIPIASLWF